MDINRHDVTISKNKDGAWEIDTKTLQVNRRDVIVWRFHPDVEQSVKAYFQFPPNLVVESKDGFDEKEYVELTPENRDGLILYILGNEDVPRQEPYYYAIFLENGFVRGENPPPKIQVGG